MEKILSLFYNKHGSIPLQHFFLLYNSDTIFSILTLHFIHWTYSALDTIT
jgi:hypothetical protein